MTSAEPFVSVIVPFWGTNIAQLADCLNALLSQDYPRERFEVIVIDNHRDPKPGLASSLPQHCVLLHEPKPGSYSARNRGLSVAKGDIIAFTDADCRPLPGWLAAGVGELTGNPGLGFIGGRIELTTRGSRPNYCEIYEFCFALNQATYIAGGGFAATANLFTRAEVIGRVGKFEESVYSGGDRLWGERASALGYSCAYNAGAAVLHPARATLGALLTKARRLAAQQFARNAKLRSTRFGVWILVAKIEALNCLSRFYELAKRWREFGILPIGGAMVVAGLISLVRAAELFRLAFGGRPQR